MKNSLIFAFSAEEFFCTTINYIIVLLCQCITSERTVRRVIAAAVQLVGSAFHPSEIRTFATAPLTRSGYSAPVCITGIVWTYAVFRFLGGEFILLRTSKKKWLCKVHKVGAVSNT
ncbi:hypothetical protein V5799_017486 [Amblyomma americanum]|uniref:Uncharacterized protein n=1 Tax=Amblyomma americanum TaxID=6943 RepID=A0AAQ4F338_AMBAM